ncbi:MAG: AI-2E family transporter [Gemmatimonadaceae bacterium]
MNDPSVTKPSVDPTEEATPVTPGAPKPDLRQTAAKLGSPQARSVAGTTIAVLAVLYSLYFARGFLIPITFALLLNFLFSPVVRALAKIHIPAQFGAAVVILALTGVIGLGVYELSTPAERWMNTAPETLSVASGKLRTILRPLERITRSADSVSAAPVPGSGAQGGRRPAQVVVQEPSLVSRVFGTTGRFLAGFIEIIFLLYFLLAAGDLFLQKLVDVLPTISKKKAAVDIARQTESAISTYLLTATLVNLGEGIVVAGAMYFVGLPNPALWGALVFFFEFIPYLGAAGLVFILAAAGLTTFTSISHALLAPAVYLGINLLQANVVSPLLMGDRLELNPVAIFVGLAFWFYIWGVAGALLAVPLMATFKILCDYVPWLASIGEFLSKRHEHERREAQRGLG